MLEENPEVKVVQSTVANRPTIGSLLLQTQKQHLREEIEVGEFVEHVGKHEYMKKLREIVEARQNDPAWQDKFYLSVLTRRNPNPSLSRIIEIYIQPRHTRPKPEPGLTLFSYDPKKKELKLEWVLPHKRAFTMFLKNEANSDPFLIECIKKYKSETLW